MHSSRRTFLKTAGCLTIGFSLGVRVASRASPLFPGLQELPQDLQRNPAINAWLEVLADGRVRVLTGKMELGQGIRTAVAQLAAEELDMDLSRVDVLLAETGRTPDEGYTTGSNSIESSGLSVRYAAAAAKQQLLELAAKKMNVPVAELTISNGMVVPEKGGRGLSFSELLDGRQLTGEVREPVVLKARDLHRVVGRAVPRDEVAGMVCGKPLYVHDLDFPGMVHARVLRPPSYGGRLLSFDEQAVRKEVPGFLKTVVDGSFLAVIATSEYHAIKAQQLLRENAKWADGPSFPKVGRGQLPGYLMSLPVQTERVGEKGSMKTPVAGSTLQARYSKPYIMHGSIGPSCAVALYDKDELHVWTHSQGVYPLRETLSNLLQQPVEKIHVKGVPGAGCYGHNGADDAAADAALLAVAYPGKHVRVEWSREDEHAWEPYGSAMVMELEAWLDGSGRISHWQYTLWSDTHGTRPGGNADNLLPARYLAKPFTGEPSGYSGGATRNAEPYYTIPNQQVDVHFFRGPLRVSSLRGLGAYGNLFAIESFMDELAEKAGKDPYTFRLLHLDDERAKDVVRKLREITQDGPQGEKMATGMAFSRYKNGGAYCAVAARVSVDEETGVVRVLKMWAVVDAGEVINPDGISNQIEGGMVQSASWTLLEQVRFDEKQVTSRHWGAYPIFRFGQDPEVEVVVLERPTDGPLGAGEAAQGPAAAAIVNAVYRACGKRVRDLPVMPLK